MVSQHRSGYNLLIIMAVTFGLGLAASAYLNYVQFARARDEKSDLTGQLTDVRYQLKQNQLALAASPAASASPSPSPSVTPTVLGATTVKMEQLGVYLSASDPVSDLTYAFATQNGLAVANLTTTGLVAQYSACKPGMNALGQLVRRPKTSAVPKASKLIKSFGDYNYTFTPATYNCATDSAGRATLAAARAAMIDATLPTLAQIK